MDKRTLLAVVLSVVVISLGFFLQGVFFPAAKTPASPATSQSATASGQASSASASTTGQPGTQTGQPAAGFQASANLPAVDHVIPSPTDTEGLVSGTHVLKTNFFEAPETRGGRAASGNALLGDNRNIGVQSIVWGT